MSDTINIAGLDKAEVLAALYNNAKPLGYGILHFDPTPMTAEAAQAIIDNESAAPDYPGNRRGLYFDYLKGRVMKVNLSDDEFDPRLYDRDNGQGAADKALDSLSGFERG